jgi:hypothetical protein
MPHFARILAPLRKHLCLVAETGRSLLKLRISVLRPTSGPLRNSTREASKTKTRNLGLIK